MKERRPDAVAQPGHRRGQVSPGRIYHKRRYQPPRSLTLTRLSSRTASAARSNQWDINPLTVRRVNVCQLRPAGMGRNEPLNFDCWSDVWMSKRPILAFSNDLVRFADHDERLTTMRQAEARYEVNVDTDCGRYIAKRADPDIAVGFQAGQVVAGRHSNAPSMKLRTPSVLKL